MQTEQLARLRKAKGFTQMEVAEELGLSRQAISRWESGQAFPSTENLKKLSVLYGVPVDELLHGSSEGTEQGKPASEDVTQGTGVRKTVKWIRRTILVAVLSVLLILGLVTAAVLWYTHSKKRVWTFDSMESSSWVNSSAREFDMTW